MTASFITVSRRHLILVIVFALLLVPREIRAQASTDTQVLKGVVEVFPGDVNPCTGDVGTTMFAFNGVAHITTTSNGGVHVTSTIQGTLTFVPDDASRPSYEGHFTTSSSDNSNSSSGTFTSTFSTQLSGSDGSVERFRVLDHITVTSSGVVIQFERPACF